MQILQFVQNTTIWGTVNSEEATDAAALHWVNKGTNEERGKGGRKKPVGTTGSSQVGNRRGKRRVRKVSLEEGTELKLLLSRCIPLPQFA